MHRPLRSSVLVSVLFAAACAEGGTTDVPASEVEIAANHHLLWFRSLPGFGAASQRPAAVNSGHAILGMATDSTYRLTFPNNSQSAQERYALANTARLSIYQTGSGRNPSTVFQGGYQLAIGSARPDLFFTDRVSAGDSTSVGLYLGTRVVPGQDELGGAWHVFSAHVMMNPPTQATARTVARFAHGEVTIADGAPGTARAISGTGQESGADPSTVPVTFSGSVQNLLGANDQGDGTCTLSVGYTNTGVPTDTRTFHAVAGNNLLLAVDEEESDSASGLLTMVRKFDAPATPADSAQIVGTYWVGGYTTFVNPTNAGSDAFVGTLTLAQSGGFRLDAVGHQGIDFSYTGSWTLAADGAFTVQIAGNGGETWRGAIARGYDTLVLCDPIVEVRSNNVPELNLLYGIRQRSSN